MHTVTSYLDFGMTKDGKRTCYDYREGPRAYDIFMGARCLNDLMAYREGNVDDVYHPEDMRDQLRKYSALSVCSRHTERLTYYEVGSSAMGVIDGLEYLNRTYHELQPAAITWLGADNSTFMNSMARYTHQGYDIRLSQTPAPVACDLFFAKGVSLLHAIDNEKLLCDVLTRSQVALFDYTFARRDTISAFVGTGLPVTFLNLDECRRRLEVPGKTLILNPYTLRTYHQAPSRITYDCIYGDESMVCEYLAELEGKIADFEDLWQRPLIRGTRQAAMLV